MLSMPLRAFKAKLRAGEGGGFFVMIPYDIEKAYGKKNMVPVKATFDGEPYVGSIANMGSGPFLVVRKAIREKIAKEPGDTVNVTVRLDTAPRTVALPSDIASFLRTHKKEKPVFDSLSFTHRKEYVEWITGAKKPETKQRRLMKMLEMLKERRRTRR